MRRLIHFLIIGILLLSGMGVNAESSTKTTPYSTTVDIYDMVIIAPEAFSASIQPLLTHKNTHGIKTFLKTVEEIYSEYAGRDPAEQIKYFIKDAFDENNVSYVLLLGDINQVPIRKTSLYWDYFGDIIVPDVLTDLYYSDIYNENGSFASWDSNNDGRYSEIHMIMNYQPYNETYEVIDDVEGIPDLMIGRLPCTTINDVKNVVDKIVTYETTTYGSDWFHRLILMGGDTFPQLANISEGEVVTEYISSLLSDFTSIRLWTSLNTFRPMKINRELSKGAGFVSYSGHGLEYGLATSPFDSDKKIHYLLPYILGIHNKGKYPIMYFDACLTGAFDYQLWNIPIPCFAWSLVKKHDSGAIACIAATRVAFGGFAGDPLLAGASCLQKYFFEAYTPGEHLGSLFVSAQQQYIQNVINTIIYDPLTIQEFTLIGDPSLKIGGYQ